jgi:hypothetical protein
MKKRVKKQEGSHSQYLLQKALHPFPQFEPLSKFPSQTFS